MYLYAKAYPAENQGEFLPSGQKLRGYAKHRGKTEASLTPHTMLFLTHYAHQKTKLFSPLGEPYVGRSDRSNFCRYPSDKKGLTRGFCRGFIRGSK